MATEMWAANEEVRSMMEHLIREYHHDLLPVMDDIAIIFREKAANSSGNPVFGKTKKTPALLSVLSNKTYKFVIELANDVWVTLDGGQQMALLDHHLCACVVEFDEESGEYKSSLRAPDVVAYKEEVERHGTWRPEQVIVGDSSPSSEE